MRMLRQSRLQVPLLILLLLGLTVPISVRSFLFPLPKQLSDVGTSRVSFSISTSNSLGSELRVLGQPTNFFQSHRPDRDIERGRPKRNRISNALKKFKIYSMPFIASVYFWFGLRVPQANARLTEQTTIVQSNFDLRPDQAAEESIRGGSDVLERKEQGYAEIPTIGNSQRKTSTKENPRQSNKAKKEKKAKKSKSIYGDIEDGDFEDDFGLDDDAPKQPSSVTKADIARAQAMQSNTAHMQFMAYKKKDPYLKLKVGAAVFIPTFGGQSLREFYRRRKEETYVQKGLEIMRAQEKEYFNITNTTADSDVVDELKKLKDKDKDKNKDKDDDESDDDNDDDDEDIDDDDDNDIDDSDSDDDDEPDRRRRPKKPRGGGPKNDDGGSSGTGGGFDPGYGDASDEDKERLRNLFDRS